MNKNIFVQVKIDKNIESFITNISNLIVKILVYIIKKTQIEYLLIEKVMIPEKNQELKNIFSNISEKRLFKYISYQ